MKIFQLCAIAILISASSARANFLWASKAFWLKSCSPDQGYTASPWPEKHAIAQHAIRLHPGDAPEEVDAGFILMVINDRVMAYYVYHRDGKELTPETAGLFLSTATETGTTWEKPKFAGEGENAVILFTRSDQKVVAQYFKKEKRLLIADARYLDALKAVAQANEMKENGLGDNWKRASEEPNK